MPFFSNRPSFFRYLPTSPNDKDWGLFITTAGYSRSHPKSAGYPPDKHPSAYHFQWKTGRILDDFQILYILRGEGRFESATNGTAKIKAGDAFLLFPGEWHRYKPNPKTGWDELWIGFDGSVPRQLVTNKILLPSSPVFKTESEGETLRELFLTVIETLENEPPAYSQILSGLAYRMLTLLYAIALGSGKKAEQNDLIVRHLKNAIDERLPEKIAWDVLARELGMSYSMMRHIFRKYTGISPHQYQLQLRLNKARLLLNTTSNSQKIIAQAVGFECPYHFAHLFKRKTGRSPGDWRQAVHGGNWIEKAALKKSRTRRKRSRETKSE